MVVKKSGPPTGTLQPPQISLEAAQRILGEILDLPPSRRGADAPALAAGGDIPPPANDDDTPDNGGAAPCHPGNSPSVSPDPNEAGRGKQDAAGLTTADAPVTEDSVAGSFAEQYDGRLRYCHSTGAWFEWNGAAWRADLKSLAFNAVRIVARNAAVNENDKVRVGAGKAGFARGVEAFARADPRLAVTVETWDQDPFLLGTPAGTVDLRTCELYPGDPKNGITKLTGAVPAEMPICPRWEQFLYEATGGDVGMVRFLQQWFGYCLTGIVAEHALVFIYGPGGNGKSLILNVVAAIMGEYATTAAMDTFTASRDDKHPTDLAMLRGSRLVTASETEEGRAWAEGRIKQMTGGDTITARFMRQDFFSFRPNFKLTIVGNHKPALRNVDDATRRRFNIVPFMHKPASPDPELEAKLKDEWPGILRWMIEGCLDWQHNGLVRPASVTDATASYFSDQDLLQQWIDERCRVDCGRRDMWDWHSTLFEDWTKYAHNAGEPAGSGKAFTEAMARKGFERYHAKAGRGFRGIQLLREANTDHRG